MNNVKLSDTLARRLEEAGEGDVVELIVELCPSEPLSAAGASRVESIAGMKAAFERDMAPVEAAIESAGGQVTGAAWINQTLQARIPAAQVGPLAQLDSVLLLDLARALERG
jgi:hypothetical protein